MVHLLVEWLGNHCPISELHLSILDVRLVEEGQGMLHPIHVVSIREVFLGVSSPRLLSGLGGMDLLSSLVEQILQFERLNQVSVPDHAAVTNANILVLFQDVINDPLPELQIFGISVNWGILLHVNLKLAPQVSCRDGTGSMPHFVH